MGGRTRRFWCTHCYKDLGVDVEAIEREANVPFGCVTCPACGKGIDARKIADGEYDYPRVLSFLTWLVIAWAVGGPLVLALRFGWPVWKALALAWGTSLIYVVVKLLRPRR